MDKLYDWKILFIYTTMSWHHNRCNSIFRNGFPSIPQLFHVTKQRLSVQNNGKFDFDIFYTNLMFDWKDIEIFFN